MPDAPAMSYGSSMGSLGMRNREVSVYQEKLQCAEKYDFPSTALSQRRKDNSRNEPPAGTGLILLADSQSGREVVAGQVPLPLSPAAVWEQLCEGCCSTGLRRTDLAF